MTKLAGINKDMYNWVKSAKNSMEGKYKMESFKSNITTVKKNSKKK